MTAAENVVPISKPTHSVVAVDKATAQRWLEQNKSNRNLRKRLVALYAQDMRSGNWKMSGDPIRFGVDGTLYDGQHRLHGVVLADVTVPMLVIRGLASDAQSFIDIGAKRTVADALSIAGTSQAVNLAAAARCILLIEGTQMPSHGDILALVEDRPEIMDAVLVGQTVYRSLGGGAALYSAAFHYLSSRNPLAAGEFFDALAHGENLAAGSPILALRHRLLRYPLKPGNQFSSVRRNMGMFIRAWNAWRSHSPMRIMRMSAGPMPKARS